MNTINYVLAIILILLIIYTCYINKFEQFIPISNDVVDSNGNLNINIDDIGGSEYGNISLDSDIDSLQQRVMGLDFEDKTIDNSDVVAQIVSQGDSIFQPSHGIGVSSTSNAGMSSFVLAGPSGLPFLDDESSYDVATNGQISIDERLAIAQQHRGSLAKKALEGNVRSTKNMYKKYFVDEQNEVSNRIWWDDSGDDDLETDYGFDISMF